MFVFTEEEDSLHIFKCSFYKYKVGRKIELEMLIKKLRKNTSEEAIQLVRVGITNVSNESDMTDDSRDFLTDTSHQEVAAAQTSKGWECFLHGRTAMNWREIGPAEVYQKPSSEWAKVFTKNVVQYGLNMWVLWNQLVHGNTKDISLVKQTKARTLVERIYLSIAPWAPTDSQWLFYSVGTET